MPLERTIPLLAERGVGRGIFSNIDNAECLDGGEGKREPLLQGAEDSVALNLRLLEELRPYGNLYMLYWIRPAEERMSGRIAGLIERNRDKILGLKVHPFLSGMGIDDPRIADYLRFADKARLPVAVHTAGGGGCECRRLAKFCRMFPGASFIAVHMDLGTDHREAAGLVSSIANLYGDVSWIPYNEYVRLGARPDKVLFGSDIPINPKVGYEFYEGYFQNARKEERLLWANAERLFFGSGKDIRGDGEA